MWDMYIDRLLGFMKKNYWSTLNGADIFQPVGRTAQDIDTFQRAFYCPGVYQSY